MTSDRKKPNVALWLLAGLGGLMLLAAVAASAAAIYGMMIDRLQLQWNNGPNPFGR